MRSSLPTYRRYFFTGIILIALGVTFSTTLKASAAALGIVFIALGGLLFVAAMARKRRHDPKRRD